MPAVVGYFDADIIRWARDGYIYEIRERQWADNGGIVKQCNTDYGRVGERVVVDKPCVFRNEDIGDACNICKRMGRNDKEWRRVCKIDGIAMTIGKRAWVDNYDGLRFDVWRHTYARTSRF